MNGSLATSKRNGSENSITYVVARATVLVTTSYATRSEGARLRLMRRGYSTGYGTDTVSVYTYISVHTIPIIIERSEKF